MGVDMKEQHVDAETSCDQCILNFDYHFHILVTVSHVVLQVSGSFE